jgi:hypothetical protein
MGYRWWIPGIALLAAIAAGCGKPSSSSDSGTPTSAAEAGNNASGAKAEEGGPAEAVARFLEAVRTGNDEVAAQMFTPLARKRTAEMDIQIAPRGSDTARFEVGQIEPVGDSGARVASKWTDLDKNGQPRTDEIVWMVRREAEGWRVAGMAATVFEGEPPLLLDFEQPQETMRRLELLRQEVKRRMAAKSQQPQTPQDAGQALEPQPVGSQTPVGHSPSAQDPQSLQPVANTAQRPERPGDGQQQGAGAGNSSDPFLR